MLDLTLREADDKTVVLSTRIKKDCFLKFKKIGVFCKHQCLPKSESLFYEGELDAVFKIQTKLVRLGHGLTLADPIRAPIKRIVLC